MRFPYSRPTLTDDDIDAAVSVLKGQFLTQGPITKVLERELEQTFSVKHAVVCNSATSALFMAYSAIGLGPDAGLITSPISFVATANAARMCKAPVSFADVDPVTGNVTLNSVADAIENANFNVAAVSVVHLGGLPCDIEKIGLYCKQKGIAVVEDACHAPMARYGDDCGNLFQVGNCVHSEASTLSFHAIKHIAAGEGGVLLTNNKSIYDIATKLRSHGIEHNPSKFLDPFGKNHPWYYEMHSLGYNFRLNEISCALALSQLKRIRANIIHRGEIAQTYSTQLENLENVQVPKKVIDDPMGHAWHLYPIRINFENIKLSRSDLMTKLFNYGIGTQVHYIPIYRHPYYSEHRDLSRFVGAEAYYEKTLSLPMYEGLREGEAMEISDRLCECLHSNR
jgi:dTDP-4-amino-4,6-dideoxygalactose transaminase